MDNDPVLAAGAMPGTIDLTVRDALGWATINGAEAMGLAAVTGSLTPGKQADVIVVGGDRLNMTPLAAPVAAMVVQAGAANVRDVFVAGRAVKRDFVLCDVDQAAVRRLAETSRERIFAAVERAGEPVLPPEPEGYQDLLNAMAEANFAQVEG